MKDSPEESVKPPESWATSMPCLTPEQRARVWEELALAQACEREARAHMRLARAAEARMQAIIRKAAAEQSSTVGLEPEMPPQRVEPAALEHPLQQSAAETA